MKTTYECNGWMKFAEEDVWEHGCVGPTLYATGTDRFAAGTADELIKKLQTFVGSESESDLLLDSCEETGRLDIQVYENAEGYAASPSELAQWKAGDLKVWLSTYTFGVEKVTRETISLHSD